MPNRPAAAPASVPPTRRLAGKPGTGWDDPVREYVRDFAAQLALMAREVGDEALGQALDIAVEVAARPVVIDAPLKRRA